MNPSPSALQVGLGKADISVYEPGKVMLGWAHHDNVSHGISEPLFARALVLIAADRAVAFVCCDLCMITVAVRQGVLARLEKRGIGLGPHNVMLTATHTHSGPSGFSSHAFYNMGCFGFSPVVFEGIVSGIERAIMQAYERAVPGRGYWCEAPIPVDRPVAFNRSMQAYLQNPEAKNTRSAAEALDRAALLLRLETNGGAPLGCVHWFAVHGTSVHAEHQKLHPDNKGVAARLMEEHFAERGARDFVAIFSQAAAGDVSPNFRYSPTRKKMIGISDDDLKSAELNARLQVESAMAMFERAPRDGRPLTPELSGRVEHADFSALPVAPRFVGGTRGLRTQSARYGVAMAHGTLEGPGPLAAVPWVHATLHGAKRKLGLQDSKVPFVEVGKGLRGRLLGAIPQTLALALGHVDASVDFLRLAHEADALGSQPWTPKLLPLQVLKLGSFALVGIPAEPTTVAGYRIRALVKGALGVERVVPQGYANGYVSYITTPEEYAVQAYEGASTHFGPWTLPGVLTALLALCGRDLRCAPDAPVLGPKLQPLDLDGLIRQREAGAPAQRRKRVLNGLLGASA